MPIDILKWDSKKQIIQKKTRKREQTNKQNKPEGVDRKQITTDLNPVIPIIKGQWTVYSNERDYQNIFQKSKT